MQNRAKAIISRLFILGLISLHSFAPGQENLPSKIKKCVDEGNIVYRLSEPGDIKKLLGPPDEEKESKDGGMLKLELAYGNTIIGFGKMRNDPVPFTLLWISEDGKNFDIGQQKKLKLRTNADLKKIDRFWGLQNISLVKLDLTREKEFLESMSFDSLTEWPEPDRLPSGFDPAGLLESSKNPGLGIRALHQQGIDGTGVGIAIIDQPLLLGHEEYTSSLVHYDASGFLKFPPQMHGSPVASIAVGKNIGVAPGAALAYYAVPMWERDNNIYIRALEKILRLNQKLPADEKIRAVSISTGMFSHYPHFKEWKEMLQKAEDSGILVITCDPSRVKYGILSLTPGEDPDQSSSYRPGYYSGKEDALRVPGSNRALASHRGINVYTFDRMGGMSWGAPYISGLAVLGFQVAPNARPADILKLMLATAETTAAGLVVNPKGFIKAVKLHKKTNP